MSQLNGTFHNKLRGNKRIQSFALAQIKIIGTSLPLLD